MVFLFLWQPRLHEFIEGASRLKGHAKAIDIWRMETKAGKNEKRGRGGGTRGGEQGGGTRGGNKGGEQGGGNKGGGTRGGKRRCANTFLGFRLR